MTGGGRIGWVLALLLLLLWASPAQAHKMKVFAAPDGDGQISGYVYFPSGGRGRHVPLRAEDGAGRLLFQGQTDQDGGFRFAAPPGPVTVRAEGADGHAASLTLGQEPKASPDMTLSPGLGADGTMAVAGDAAAAGLETVVQRAVAQQIRPLREQLDATYEKIWWHDVMGGLGVIFGLGGLAYGFTARRQTERGGR